MGKSRINLSWPRVQYQKRKKLAVSFLYHPKLNFDHLACLTSLEQHVAWLFGNTRDFFQKGNERTTRKCASFRINKKDKFTLSVWCCWCASAHTSSIGGHRSVAQVFQVTQSHQISCLKFYFWINNHMQPQEAFQMNSLAHMVPSLVLMTGFSSSNTLHVLAVDRGNLLQSLLVIH